VYFPKQWIVAEGLMSPYNTPNRFLLLVFVIILDRERERERESARERACVRSFVCVFARAPMRKHN